MEQNTPTAPTVETIPDLLSDPAFMAAFAKGEAAAVARRDAVVRSIFAPEFFVLDQRRAALGDKAPPETEREFLDRQHRYFSEIDRQVAAEAAAAAAKSSSLPFAFAPKVSVAVVSEAKVIAHEALKTLGVDQIFAEGAIKVIEKSHAGRRQDTGVPRPMNERELAKYEFILREKFGEKYDASIGAFEQAVSGLSPKASQWVRDAVHGSDPHSASWFLISLINAMAANG